MRHRHHLLRGAGAALLLVACAGYAAAQTGRVGGVVKDEMGQPIKGATITAENPSASPSSFTATTDDKGRFSIIGLRTGQWTFTAQAPGYAPEAGRPRLDSDYAAPRTPNEKTLAAVWQEVLGRERIGIHDNFFELGGSSLLLVEIESRLREVFGREIPFVQIFRNPTIHSLAQALEGGERRPAEPASLSPRNASAFAVAAPPSGRGSATRPTQ